MDKLSDEEISELAIKVAARLQGTMVTRLIPKDVQEGLAKLGHGYPMHYQQFIPIGSGGIITDITLAPDGSLTLKLADQSHQYFWSAILSAE